MSFEVFVMRFEHGAPAPLDPAVVREVLDPYVVARGADGQELCVETADGGEADVRIGADGVTFHRFGGAGIMDLIAALLRRLEAVLVVPGGPFVVHREEAGAQVTPGLGESSGWPVVVATDGAAVARAIEEA
ncbi:hypothetical protein ACFY8W_22770 [Streptomyces sp. NPDC012637]|uniref:hypothetical protein n=1 Tax=Streptomyces sp. NPDC012637 TaxID=3364842 RepID=UPI0036E136F6